MAFLKLGDLIDGGHPVTVGDDGTVFTRLNVGQIAGTVDEAPTSSQEISVEDLPIDFLSDSSFAALANDVGLTVINFEDYQKDGVHVQDNLSNTTSNANYKTEDNADLSLDLDEYQLACTSNELLESCLQYNATERESDDDDVAQYLNEDLFVEHLDDSLDSVATEQLFHGKIEPNTTADDQYKEIASVTKLYPKDSRVLFDIGNLSLGTVPEHQGFIKLTSNAGFGNEADKSTFLQEPIVDSQSKSVDDLDLLISSPVTIKIEPVDDFDENPSEGATNIQIGAVFSQQITDSEFFISPSESMKIKPEPVVDETNDVDSDVDVTTETELIFEIDSALELNAIQLTKKPCVMEEDDAFPTVHCTILNYPKAPTKEESNDCNSETKETSKPTATAAKPSVSKHKCTEPDCDETFPSLPAMKRHCSLVHDSIKPFYCTIDGCGLAFRFASYLSRHIRGKHDGVRKHLCTECGNFFLTSRDLAMHERKHTGERPERCPDPGCELTFSTRSIANTHFLAKHRMVKAHICDECGKPFGTVSNLREHEMTHTGVKNFICMVAKCGKAFHTKGKLKRHSISHTKIRPFECDQCGLAFRLRSSLNRHMRKKHSGNPNDLVMF